MDIINYIIIGVLQGIIEWLPISSQGNIIIYLSNVIGITTELAFNYSIFLHFGTVIAAIVYFRKYLAKLLRFNIIKEFLNNPIKYKENKEHSNLLRFIIIAVIFTLVISTPLYFLFGTILSDLNVSLVNLLIGVLLIVTGFILLFPRFIKKRVSKLSTKNSIILGLFQGLSILPGLSRSGLTTSVLLFEGFSPEKAFEISFLLSIPTIIVGEVGILIFSGFNFTPMIFISILVAFIVGYFTIDLLIRFARRINFSYFCFILGIIYILIYLV